MCACDPDLMANSRDIPRPSQWKLTKLQIWLDDNPMTDDGECAFLLAAVDEGIGASVDPMIPGHGQTIPRSVSRTRQRHLNVAREPSWLS
jgi:hypothetical protein